MALSGGLTAAQQFGRCRRYSGHRMPALAPLDWRGVRGARSTTAASLVALLARQPIQF
jgi:hypothetical protein